ncbi:cytochrome P450 [Microlunatus soli]|uniref:Cytochrome P450 n=1 Tax=Microlunatus soli TaxID=630515 RepID=A0A1H1WR21_9ACTN|nr:cytochrome P450 [Microlunatus soli]SDS99524.1 Cytochrome P450 [Microlunatus soli]
MSVSDKNSMKSIDLFSEEVLADPYPTYRRLRDTGPAVYLERIDAWALARDASVRAALTDWETFSSADGIALTDGVNQALKGMILASDPPEHDRLRAVMNERLAPRVLDDFRANVRRQADTMVRALVGRRSFDAVEELAKAFPVAVLLDLIGLPDDGRDKVLAWADGTFNAFGPDNELFRASLASQQDKMEYLESVVASDRLTPGSIGRGIYEAADRGEIDRASCVNLLAALVDAGLDTTINAMSTIALLFSTYPDQWQRLRADRSRIPAAFNEILRLESPVQWFARGVTTDYEMDGVKLPAGARVLLLFGSANRDERAWSDPDTFDIDRDASRHLAFGRGVHVCAGQGIARLEAHALLAALAEHVARFETGEPQRRLNNTVRGLTRLPTSIEPA